MAVYRFRVSFEDHNDIYRDIDILSSQTFEDLHLCIQQAIGFDASKNAVFYTSNDYWRREKEIPLKIVSENAEGKSKSKKTYLCDYIDDPHQKLVYFFDFDMVENAVWTFTVELIKLSKEDPSAIYPSIAKSLGTAIRQYKVKKNIDSSIDEENEKPKVKSKKSVVEKIFDEEELGTAAELEDDVDLSDGFGEEGEEDSEVSMEEDDSMEDSDDDEMMGEEPQDDYEPLDENFEE